LSVLKSCGNCGSDVILDGVLLLKGKTYSVLGRGLGLVVRAMGWNAGDPGSIVGRDGLCTFGCIPPAP
jgi:hypothetical protein